MKKLSNSLIRSVLTTRCEYFIKLSLDGVRSDPTPSMLNGLVFEHELLGQTVRKEEEPHFPLLKNGNISKVETDIRNRAQEVKAMFPEIGIEPIKVQYYLENEHYKGHPDLLAKVNGVESVIDVKFTKLKLTDRYLGWAEMEEKLSGVEFQHIIYPLLDNMKPFYYLIVSPSWIRFVKVENSQESLDYFLSVADDVRKRIERMTFEPLDDYNNCNSCFLKEKCDKRATIPNVEIIQL